MHSTHTNPYKHMNETNKSIKHLDIPTVLCMRWMNCSLFHGDMNVYRNIQKKVTLDEIATWKKFSFSMMTFFTVKCFEKNRKKCLENSSKIWKDPKFTNNNKISAHRVYGDFREDVPYPGASFFCAHWIENIFRWNVGIITMRGKTVRRNDY